MVELIKTSPQTYHIHTLGCQMNVHDSERMAGLLDKAGYLPVTQVPEKLARATRAGDNGADVVVINTCSVRENAVNKLFGHLGQLAEVKRERPELLIAVGGCMAQQMQKRIVEKAPWVDAVFGTHNIDVLPVLLSRAVSQRESAVEIEEALKVFPSSLPAHRQNIHSAWVAISVGCNNTCTFCIVPHLRGKEMDRPLDQVLDEVRAVVKQGAIEVTLLGQNVNSYGWGFGRRGAFAELLRAAGQIEGLERLRFTSPHPAAFTDDVINAMAEVPVIAPSLHFPLQSGSDTVLRAMRRSYRSAKFMKTLETVRNKIPHAAVSTDIIVGFPGETEEDFEQTMNIVREARFASAFTFIYSPRPGTAAAAMENQVDPQVIKERYGRLLALQEQITLEENQKQVGEIVEVLVEGSPGKKDNASKRYTGRAFDSRLVHFASDPKKLPRPGDMVKVRVTHAAPHHLVADSALDPQPFYELRPTRSGDIYQARTQTPEEKPAVALGIPVIRSSAK